MHPIRSARKCKSSFGNLKDLACCLCWEHGQSRVQCACACVRVRVRVCGVLTANHCLTSRRVAIAEPVPEVCGFCVATERAADTSTAANVARSWRPVRNVFSCQVVCLAAGRCGAAGQHRHRADFCGAVYFPVVCMQLLPGADQPHILARGVAVFTGIAAEPAPCKRRTCSIFTRVCC